MNAEQLWKILVEKGVVKTLGYPCNVMPKYADQIVALRDAARQISHHEAFNRSTMGFTKEELMVATKPSDPALPSIPGVQYQYVPPPFDVTQKSNIAPPPVPAAWEPQKPITETPPLFAKEYTFIPPASEAGGYTDLLPTDIPPGTALSHDPLSHWFTVLGCMAPRRVASEPYVFLVPGDTRFCLSALHKDGWWMKRQGEDTWLRCRRILDPLTGDSTLDTLTRFTP